MWLGARRFNPFIPTHKWEGHIYYYIPFSLFLCVWGVLIHMWTKLKKIRQDRSQME
jgi:hypothetical protein